MTNISLKDFLKTTKIDIAILVATDIEQNVVLQNLVPYSDEESIQKIYSDNLTYYCGLFGKYSSAVIKTNKMGSTQRGASIQVTTKLIEDLNPKILIMPGIAFGKDKEKQEIGDILVSTSLAVYEPARVNDDLSMTYRGPTPEANEVLINRFSEKEFIFNYEGIDKKVKVSSGMLLSGEKLIDNLDFKKRLLTNFPDAIGGEMEGAGVYASSDYKKIPWIIIKSICDWGDGEKNKTFQELAANSSIKYIHKKCSEDLIFDALGVSAFKTQETASEIKIEAADILKKIVSPRDYSSTIKSLKSSSAYAKVVNDKNRSIKKIHYEYYTQIDNNITKGFLFLGKDITLKNVFEEFIKAYDTPDFLEIYLTKKYNKLTNNLIERKQAIFERIIQYKLDDICNKKVFYIDEFIWEISEFESNKSTEIDNVYIDQQIYSYDLDTNQEYSIEERSVDFFKNRIYQEHSPVSVIFGSGGVGKSTFCKSIENTFNEEFKNKKVFLIKGERIEFCPIENVTINSLEDLFNLYKDEAGFPNMTSEDFKLNFVSGNIIVVIDALDEIEATLDTQINLTNFFESLSKLEERFYSTKIILTTREQFRSKLENINENLEIKYYTIKGFTSDDLEDYLNRRYEGNYQEKEKILSFLIKHNLKKDTFVIPLFAHWACTILDENNSLEFLETESKYFLHDNNIDQLFMELVNREKEKKGLQHIEIDDFFLMLYYVIFDYHGQIKKDDFYSYCKDMDIKQEDSEKISTMTMFETSHHKITIKYDILHNIIKSRFINCSLHNNYKVTDDLIKLLKEMYLGKNELFDDLIETLSISDPILLSSITKMIKELKQKFINESTLGSNLKVNIKKAISGLLYILISKINPTMSRERTDIIKEVYENELSYIFIYGDFYPLDFSDLHIKHSLFDAFTQFNKCQFPDKDSIIFSDTAFKNINCHKKFNLNNNHFKNCTFQNTNIKDLLDSKTEDLVKKNKSIKKDLRAITRFIDDSQKSLNYIKMHSGVTYARGHQKYIEVLIKNGYLEEKIHNANKEFRICNKYRGYIEDVKLGSFNCKDIQNLINNLLTDL